MVRGGLFFLSRYVFELHSISFSPRTYPLLKVWIKSAARERFWTRVMAFTLTSEIPSIAFILALFNASCLASSGVMFSTAASPVVSIHWQFEAKTNLPQRHRDTEKSKVKFLK